MKFKCLGVKNYTIQNILEHKHGAGRPANILGSIKISVIKQITDDRKISLRQIASYHVKAA